VTTAPAGVRADGADRARYAVTAVFAANGLIMASWATRIVAIRDLLGLTGAQIGLVLLAMSGGAVLALPASGAVVARLGPAGTVRLASTVCVSGLVLVGLGGSVPVVVAGLFAVGFGSGTWDVAMNVEGADVERHLGRAIMPRFHAAFSVGTVVGALVAAGTYALGVSTAVHLTGVAVVAIAVAQLAVTAFLPAEPAPHDEPAAVRRNPLAAWREPRTLLVGVMVLAFAFTEGSANDWLTLALVDGYGVAKSHGVLGFGVFLGAMTAGRTFGTGLLDRYGRVVVLRSSAVLAAAGLLLVIVGGSVPVAVAGAVLWGLGASLGFPVGMSAAADDPAHAAARVSVVASIGYTAFLAGPPLIGFLKDRIGILPALWPVLALLLLAVVVVGASRPLRVAR
jgi:fucose permease